MRAREGSWLRLPQDLVLCAWACACARECLVRLKSRTYFLVIQRSMAWTRRVARKRGEEVCAVALCTKQTGHVRCGDTGTAEQLIGGGIAGHGKVKSWSMACCEAEWTETQTARASENLTSAPPVSFLRARGAASGLLPKYTTNDMCFNLATMQLY